jgi:8-oxo-dGTP pyrophosphatase MutT (NUDIX family)
VRYATPNYTLGAVVLLRDEKGRLLLGRKPREQAWCLPGGLVERREEPRTTAVRELREEAGVRLAPEALSPAPPGAIAYPARQGLDLIFTGRAPTDQEPHPDGIELAEVAWYALDELPALTGATHHLLRECGLTP